MSNNSKLILSNQAHPGDSVSESVAGDPFKGDGYYGRSDGFHTVQISVSGLTGTIIIQGTLSVDPAETDWFSIELNTTTDVVGAIVDTTGAVTSNKVSISSLSYFEETSVRNYNFTGNYVWVRAKVSNWTDGTVNSIRLNH